MGLHQAWARFMTNLFASLSPGSLDICAHIVGILNHDSGETVLVIPISCSEYLKM